MDPVTLATITSATTLLATKVVEGLASEAATDLWGKIKAILGWSSEPASNQIAEKIAAALLQDASVAKQITELLQGNDAGVASTLVQNVNAQKVVVAQTIHDVRM